jgi:hypothetical protein
LTFLDRYELTMKCATGHAITGFPAGDLRPDLKDLTGIEVARGKRVFDPVVPVCARREFAAQADGLVPVLMSDL